VLHTVRLTILKCCNLSAMSNTRRSLLLVPVALMLGTALGCAGSQTREFARELDPLVGHADKAYFIEKYGEPDKRSALDAQMDVWEYNFGQTRLSDFGARSTLSTSTWLRLTFKNGTLSSWQAANRMN